MNLMPPGYRFHCRQWLRCLDRATADLNIILAVLAIGLAVLDMTFLVTQRLLDSRPHLIGADYVHGMPIPNQLDRVFLP
jgi:hypothetical protein